MKNAYDRAVRMIEEAKPDPAWKAEVKRRQEIREDIEAFCKKRGKKVLEEDVEVLLKEIEAKKR